MSYGYSSRLIEANKKADASHLGVYLGRKCIKHDIPVTQIAKQLGVSRMTVYNWFVGLHTPHAACVELIKELLASIKQK
jgi:DNA invertase Pin-like site-specific DNA recombinase